MYSTSLAVGPPGPTKGGRGPDLWLASLDSWMSNCFNGDRGFARFLGGESGARPTKGEPDLWLASLDSWDVELLQWG